jgi:hypothetical protein
MTVCYSCGMPLEEKMTSKFEDNYCIYCQDQESGELASYEKVREGSIDAGVRLMGKTQAEAEEMVDEMLPKLPRWKKESPAVE